MLEFQKTWAELEKETNEVNTNVWHLIRTNVAPVPQTFNPPVATMPTWFAQTNFERADDVDLEKSIHEDEKPKPPEPPAKVVIQDTKGVQKLKQ